MEGRTGHSIKNIAAGIINKVILIILPFSVRTIMVNVLGSEYLGLSSLFTSILTVLNLTELGFGSALVYSMYKPIAENDNGKISALLNLYKTIYRWIGIALLVVGIIVMPLMPYLIKDECPSDINLYILYIIYLGNTVVSYLAFAHRKALLTAYQRSDIISNINTFISIGLYGTQIILLVCVKNYYAYVVVLPLFTLIENICAAILSYKIYPQYQCSGKVEKKDRLAIKEHVKGIALQKICSATRNSFDSIVISLYLGLTTIAMYNNYFFILSAVHSFLYQIPDAIRASVGNSIAGEKVEKNFKDFSNMTFIYMWINSLCTICLFCLYKPFMYLWMGEKMAFSIPATAMFCLYFYELGMSDIISLYKDGAGLWWHGRYRVLIESIANLVFNFLFGWLWGINGILLATIITLLFIGLGYGGYIVFHYYFSEYSYMKYIILHMKYLAITVITCGVIYYICRFVAVNGIPGLLIKGCICVFGGTGILWGLYSRLKEYRNAKVFFSTIIKFIRKGERTND